MEARGRREWAPLAYREPDQVDRPIRARRAKKIKRTNQSSRNKKQRKRLKLMSWIYHSNNYFHHVPIYGRHFRILFVSYSLWKSSFNEISVELDLTRDNHAFLVLQPAVEAFFIVHASHLEKEKKEDVKENQDPFRYLSLLIFHGPLVWSFHTAKFL